METIATFVKGAPAPTKDYGGRLLWCATRCCRTMQRRSGPERKPGRWEGDQEMDGVKVIGTFNANVFFQTLATILSVKEYGVDSNVFVSLDDFEKQLAAHNCRSNNFPMRPLRWLSPLEFLAQFV